MIGQEQFNSIQLQITRAKETKLSEWMKKTFTVILYISGKTRKTLTIANDEGISVSSVSSV